MFTDDELFSTALDAERSLYDMFDCDGTYSCADDYRFQVRVSGKEMGVFPSYFDMGQNDVVLYETAAVREVQFPAEWIIDPEDPMTFKDVIEELLSSIDRREVVREMRDRLELCEPVSRA